MVSWKKIAFGMGAAALLFGAIKYCGPSHKKPSDPASLRKTVVATSSTAQHPSPPPTPARPAAPIVAHPTPSTPQPAPLPTPQTSPQPAPTPSSGTNAPSQPSPQPDTPTSLPQRVTSWSDLDKIGMEVVLYKKVEGSTRAVSLEYIGNVTKDHAEVETTPGKHKLCVRRGEIDHVAISTPDGNGGLDTRVHGHEEIEGNCLSAILELMEGRYEIRVGYKVPRNAHHPNKQDVLRVEVYPQAITDLIQKTNDEIEILKEEAKAGNTSLGRAPVSHSLSLEKQVDYSQIPFPYNVDGAIPPHCTTAPLDPKQACVQVLKDRIISVEYHGSGAVYGTALLERKGNRYERLSTAEGLPSLPRFDRVGSFLVRFYSVGGVQRQDDLYVDVIDSVNGPVSPPPQPSARSQIHLSGRFE